MMVEPELMPKNLMVALADARMSSFRRRISLGVPVVPDVWAFTYLELLFHSLMNSAASLVRMLSW